LIGLGLGSPEVDAPSVTTVANPPPPTITELADIQSVSPDASNAAITKTVEEPQAIAEEDEDALPIPTDIPTLVKLRCLLNEEWSALREIATPHSKEYHRLSDIRNLLYDTYTELLSPDLTQRLRINYDEEMYLPEDKHSLLQSILSKHRMYQTLANYPKPTETTKENSTFIENELRSIIDRIYNDDMSLKDDVPFTLLGYRKKHPSTTLTKSPPSTPAKPSQSKTPTTKASTTKPIGNKRAPPKDTPTPTKKRAKSSSQVRSSQQRKGPPR